VPFAALADPALDEERSVEVTSHADDDGHNLHNRSERGMRRRPFARTLPTADCNLHRIVL
jgi:hypothetical protein